MPVAIRLGGSRVAARLDKARNLAEAALTRGFIPNQEFVQFKNEIARALEEAHDAWQKNYLQLNNRDAIPGAKEIYFLQPTINNVPGYIAKAQKFAMQGGGTLMDEAHALFKEFAPWHAIYNDLKAKVAKRGDARLAPSVPKQVNPNQIRATCACCFRAQAVSRGGTGMAHHGYTRPGLGYQTSSCMGVSYPPYEVSNKGTIAIRQVMENLIQNANRDIATIREGKKPLVSPTTRKTVEPGDPSFQYVQSALVNRVEYEIKTINREIDALTDKINGWKFVGIPGITG